MRPGFPTSCTVKAPRGAKKLFKKRLPRWNGVDIIIHEFILDNSMDGPLFPALFSLNMLLGTDSGQAYSEQQLMDMLADAGAKDIQRLAVQTPNDSGIITGIV